jgi:hypothetical protein
MAMTQDEIRAAARACIRGPVANLTETEAAERTERLRRNGRGRASEAVYRERYSVEATIVEAGRVPRPFTD